MNFSDVLSTLGENMKWRLHHHIRRLIAALRPWRLRAKIDDCQALILVLLASNLVHKSLHRQ
jgi:hypothetical protein